MDIYRGYDIKLGYDLQQNKGYVIYKNDKVITDGGKTIDEAMETIDYLISTEKK